MSPEEMNKKCDAPSLEKITAFERMFPGSVAPRDYRTGFNARDALAQDRYREQVQFVMGHSNCYCDDCKAIARDCWNPSNALANANTKLAAQDDELKGMALEVIDRDMQLIAVRKQLAAANARAQRYAEALEEISSGYTETESALEELNEIMVIASRALSGEQDGKPGGGDANPN